jgi:hypothetical protein
MPEVFLTIGEGGLMSSKGRLSVVAMLVLIAAPGQAAIVSGVDQNATQDVSATAAGPRAHLAALMGKEDRKTINEFASPDYSLEELKQSFAASGALSCPFGFGSAQLVGASDVVVTASRRSKNSQGDSQRDPPERRRRVFIRFRHVSRPNGHRSSREIDSMACANGPVVLTTRVKLPVDGSYG